MVVNPLDTIILPGSQVERHETLTLACASSNLARAAIWGVSSAGRAPDLQSGGHEFDPRTLHDMS